jgi:lipoprotein-anchoring transpeptidase ErfK/SrfK
VGYSYRVNIGTPLVGDPLLLKRGILIFMRLPNALLTAGIMLGFATVCADAADRVKLDLSAQRAYLYSDGKVVATSRISSGRPGYTTPTGSYHVVGKERLHRSTAYGTYVGPGGGVVRRDVDRKRQSRPAGARFRGAMMPYFVRFNHGIGMHGGVVPNAPVSHGCVRLPQDKAQLFYNSVSVGTPVTVVR